MVSEATEVAYTEAPVVLGRLIERSELSRLAPPALLGRLVEEPQKAIPAIAKDPDACAQIEKVVRGLGTRHLLYNADGRQLEIGEESADLVVTSPPYWALKKYNDHEDQQGDVADYEQFLDELDQAWGRGMLREPSSRHMSSQGEATQRRSMMGGSGDVPNPPIVSRPTEIEHRTLHDSEP